MWQRHRLVSNWCYRTDLYWTTPWRQQHRETACASSPAQLPALCCHATVSRWHLTEGKSCLSWCQSLVGCLQEAEYISWVGCLPPDAAWSRGRWGHATQQCLSLTIPLCSDSFTLHSHWGRARGAEPCADAFPIPPCLNSHFLQKSWAHLAFKCASGEAEWKVGFAR